MALAGVAAGTVSAGAARHAMSAGVVRHAACALTGGAAHG